MLTYSCFATSNSSNRINYSRPIIKANYRTSTHKKTLFADQPPCSSRTLKTDLANNIKVLKNLARLDVASKTYRTSTHILPYKCVAKADNITVLPPTKRVIFRGQGVQETPGRRCRRLQRPLATVLSPTKVPCFRPRNYRPFTQVATVIPHFFLKPFTVISPTFSGSNSPDRLANPDCKYDLKLDLKNIKADACYFLRNSKRGSL